MGRHTRTAKKQTKISILHSALDSARMCSKDFFHLLMELADPKNWTSNLAGTQVWVGKDDLRGLAIDLVRKWGP